MSLARAILLGTLAVGILDGLDAALFFGLWYGTSPVRVFQGVASGLLGREASASGGVPTGLLGVFLHFVVALGVMTVYALTSRVLPILRERVLLCGILYGVAVYFAMREIVIPLSAIGPSTRATPVPVFVNGILIHMFGVGLPCAYFASRVTRSPLA